MKIRLVNFLCYNDSTFDLGTKGLTLILGDSGAGKTSIMRGIFFALFGEGSKLQSYGKTSAKVEMDFYGLRIVRTKRPNRLVVNDTHEDDVAQQIINRTFGTTFKTSGYIQQNNLSSFITMTPTDKLLFLERFAFTDLDLVDIKKSCKQHISSSREILIKTTAENSTMQSMLDEVEIPTEVPFPIPHKRNREDRAEQNERIRLKNCKTLINRYTKRVACLTAESNDLSTLNDVVNQHHHIVHENKSLLETLCNEKDCNGYEGDDNLVMLNRQLRHIVMGKEVGDMKRQYELDVAKLREMKAREIQELRELVRATTETMWKKHSRDEVVTSIQELKACIRDINRMTHLQSQIRHYEVDSDVIMELERVVEQTARALETELEIVNRGTVYTCPACETHLHLEDDNLVCTRNDLADHDLATSKKNVKHLKRVLVDTKHKLAESTSALKLKTKLAADLQGIIDKYDQVPTLHEASDDLEYLRQYKSRQSELQRSVKDASNRLEHELLSSSYASFKTDVERAGKRIASRELHLNDDEVLDGDEDHVRHEISQQNELKHKWDMLTERIRNLRAENRKYNDMIDLLQGQHTAKHGKQRASHIVDSDLESVHEAIEAEQCKLNVHELNLQQINRWKIFREEQRRYDSMQHKVDALTSREQRDKDAYAAALMLKTKILEAESITLANIIGIINTHARVYLDVFFPNHPILVQLQTFKDHKNGAKPTIHVTIDYKGMECNLGMLSGGELSRVNLAFTLALAEIFNTPLLLLDECTASLDQTTTSIVFGGIRDHFSGKIAIIIAHQVISGTFDTIINL